MAGIFLLISCKGPEKTGPTAEQELKIGTIVDTLNDATYPIFQDSKQRHWFGSQTNGVYLYDGKQLIQFTTNDGLCYRSVISIQEDQQGNIYFDTERGISRFDGHQFTTLQIDSSSTDSWKLNEGDLWFRMGWGHKGPFRYDGQKLYALEFPESPNAAAFYALFPNSSYSPYDIYCMFTDRRGHLWFGTSSLGACRFDGKSFKWLYKKSLMLTPAGGDFGIRSFVENAEGHLHINYLRTHYKILPEANDKWYEEEEGYITKLQTQKPYYLSMARDKNDAIWMVTYDDGVWRFGDGELKHYPIKKAGQSVLLFTIYIDQQDRIWLGTHNDGIYVFNGLDFEPFEI